MARSPLRWTFGCRGAPPWGFQRLLCAGGLAAAWACGTSSGPGLGPTQGDPEAAGEAIDPAPEIVIETSYGDLVVALAAAEMPATSANFLRYVDSGFYEDTTIHRVVQNFVIQGGGFELGGVPRSAGPPIPLELSGSLRHVDGTLSMARTGEPDSATSQWFLVDGRESDNGPILDGRYAAFGQLMEGFAVLAAIADTPTDPRTEVPLEDVLVTGARRR